LLPANQETPVFFHSIYKNPKELSSSDLEAIVQVLRRLDYHNKYIMEIQISNVGNNREARIQLGGAFVYLKEECPKKWLITGFEYYTD